MYLKQTKHPGSLTWRNQRCPRETWLQWTFCGFYFNWKKRGQVRSIPWWNEGRWNDRGHLSNYHNLHQVWCLDELSIFIATSESFYESCLFWCSFWTFPRKYAIHPNKCTMKKGNPSNWLATFFFNFDPPKLVKPFSWSLVSILGSFFLNPPPPPPQKKPRKTRRFVPFKQPL